jgi:hypothetical protein
MSDALEPPQPEWHCAQRIGFRFAFVYFLLNNLPFPLSGLPVVGEWLKPYADLWEPIGVWIAKHVLHLPGLLVTDVTGSGDRTASIGSMRGRSIGERAAPSSCAPAGFSAPARTGAAKWVPMTRPAAQVSIRKAPPSLGWLRGVWFNQ